MNKRFLKIQITVYKALSLITKPVERNGAFMVFLFTLLYICSQLEIPDIKGYKPYTYAGVEIFTDLYIICVILTLLPKMARPWLRTLLYLIIYPIVIVDMFCFVKFDSTISPTMLLLLSETNTNEATEFFESYLSADVLMSPVGLTLLVALLHILWNVLKRHHSFKWTKTVRKKLSAFADKHAFALKIYGGACRVFGALMIIYYIVANFEPMMANKTAMYRLFTRDTIGEVEHELTRRDRAQLYTAPQRLAFSIYSNELASVQVERLISGINDVKVDSCSFRSPNIVLIIGESCNRRHFQLYGYGKPTTPLQVKLAKQGRLIPFSDVVSPWNLTSFVFKHILSLYAVGDKGEWCDYPLFPELFRKAGYQVAFITNQFLPKAGEAVYDFSGGFFLNNPKLSAAQFDIRNASLHRFDDGVLADYDSLVAKTHDKIEAEGRGTLTILHLMGQHTLYGQRYPLKTRRKFRYTEYTDKLSKRHRFIQADYDNATVYNDSIVHQVTERFKDRDAVVIYMPDHGEECYLNDKPILGRNHSAQISYDLAQEEFHIPFWIWCSKKYVKAHPEIFRQIKQAKDKPFMTDNISQLLLYLAGIDCPWSRPAANPLSDEYDEKRPRVIKNTVNYNTLKPSKEPNYDRDFKIVK
ncbi:MAG: phosphoethanolamine transferase [Prevotella sp.]|nr:phosphoethanolamine transferase [Prevotella sp.]